MTGKGSRPAPPGAANKTAGVQFGTPEKRADRIVLYGPGGIGKTTLSCSLPGPVAVFDLDKSLGKIGGDVKTVEAGSWAAIRTALQSDGWDKIKTIVIDSGTVAQEMAEQWCYENVTGDRGARCSRLEDYGYGKGYRHVYDAFTLLLADLDKHAAAGRNVCLVCHEALFRVTNPQGEDFNAHEPKLQDAGDGGKSSIKLRVRDWADHVLIMLQDVAVDDKTGKARGAGTRTLYANVSPYWMAKHRGEPVEPMEVTTDNGPEVWKEIIGE